MFPEIQTFTIRLASKDGITSQITDYLDELILKNPNMAKKAIYSLSNLPMKIYVNSDIKPIKTNLAKLFELRIQSKSDICRFFFVIENPNVIVLYGFTKKTQKTDTKDINSGVQAYQEYQTSKKSIAFDII